MEAIKIYRQCYPSTVPPVFLFSLCYRPSSRISFTLLQWDFPGLMHFPKSLQLYNSKQHSTCTPVSQISGHVVS